MHVPLRVSKHIVWPRPCHSPRACYEGVQRSRTALLIVLVVGGHAAAAKRHALHQLHVHTPWCCELRWPVYAAAPSSAGVPVVSSLAPAAVLGTTQRLCVSRAKQAFTFPVDVSGVLKAVSVSCPARGVGMCTRLEAVCPHPRSVDATVGLATHNLSPGLVRGLLASWLQEICLWWLRALVLFTCGWVCGCDRCGSVLFAWAGVGSACTGRRSLGSAPGL